MRATSEENEEQNSVSRCLGHARRQAQIIAQAKGLEEEEEKEGND